MEIEYLGAGTVSITTKKATVIIDGMRPDSNLKPVVKTDAIYLATQENQIPPQETKLTLNTPGEYEVSEVAVIGVAARNTIDSEDAKRNTIFKVVTSEIAICVLGNIDGPLSDAQLEEVGLCDLAIIPVGGGGYTLDAKDAAQVIKQLEVKAVVPVHYAEEGVEYEVPQDDIEAFTTEIGGHKEELPKLKIKQWTAPATMTVFVLK